MQDEYSRSREGQIRNKTRDCESIMDDLYEAVAELINENVRLQSQNDYANARVLTRASHAALRYMEYKKLEAAE